MALYPLISNFQHDFVLQLLAVDTENTMDEVAAAAEQGDPRAASGRHRFLPAR